MSTLVVGVDPGVTTGLFAIAYDLGPVEPFLGPVAAQIHGSEGVIPFVQALIARAPADPVLAVEQFVVGRRAGAAGTPQAGRITRALITELNDLAITLCGNDGHGCQVFTRTAALVKPWATDKRLEAGGLLSHTVGMHHARDAARHALYAAVHCGLIEDPLSRKAIAR